MGSFGRGFAIMVIVMDLFAVVYFGGNYLTTGRLLSHPSHEEHAALATLLPAEAAVTTASSVTSTPMVPQGPFMGDAARGTTTVGKCKACHTFTQNGKNMIGPNLFGIFGASIMHQDGFAYSAAFQSQKGSVVWNEEALGQFLENPKKFTPGTKMAFPGLKNPQDRADVVAYLKSLR